MDRIVLFVVLGATARAAGEPLAAALRRRSEAFGVYASAFRGPYEPVAFAAMPLHSPLPVLHVLASAPLVAPPHWPYRRPPGVRPPYDHLASPSHTHYSRERAPLYVPSSSSPYGHRPLSPYDHQQPQIYAASLTYPMYAESQAQLEPQTTTEEPPTVLYARPKPQGGYTYYRRPTKKRNVPKKQEPVIIRIHKYKVISRGR